MSKWLATFNKRILTPLRPSISPLRIEVNVDLSADHFHESWFDYASSQAIDGPAWVMISQINSASNIRFRTVHF
jgi:hypothetical protein